MEEDRCRGGTVYPNSASRPLTSGVYYGGCRLAGVEDSRERSNRHEGSALAIATDVADSAWLTPGSLRPESFTPRLNATGEA
jgi:hypothetical protein